MTDDTHKAHQAKFSIGQVLQHRIYPFRGVVFDVDPVFNNTEEWWKAIPAEIRPSKEQPFYHLLAENEETEYVAYVSEQNLVPDTSNAPLRHPKIKDFFEERKDGSLHSRIFNFN
jgi:heat shock protein HspQ